jgi:SAM-dependent methyltransferase
MDTWSIFLGDKLGVYDALADSDGLTRDELAMQTKSHLRNANEWLEHQVTTGFLEVDDPAFPAEKRKYSLPASHAEVLCNRDSLAYLTPFVRLITAGGIQLPELVNVYRNGGGVGWEQFGDDMRTGQSEMNRPWFVGALGSEWFPSASELHDRLGAADARVADIGCGEGWSSIAMANAYPNLTVDGYDIDEASIIAARSYADQEGVTDRVTFHHVDGSTIDHDQGYDVVTLFECVHDMPYPVEVLRTARSIAKDDAIVMVMDEAVGDEFGDRTDEVERLMYGFSLFVCLPDGMSHEGSVGTGTVMRMSTLDGYATDAGFSGVSVLPIENDLWRFYQLKM